MQTTYQPGLFTGVTSDSTALHEDIIALINQGNFPGEYATILASAGLDRNMQIRAVTLLRDRHKPTQAWFSKTCNELRKYNTAPGTRDSTVFSSAPTQAGMF